MPWIQQRGVSGEYGYYNTDTGEFRVTRPMEGTTQQTVNKYFGYNPKTKQGRLTAVHREADTYNKKQRKVRNFSDITMKNTQKHQTVVLDENQEPVKIQADYVPYNEAPLEITGPEKWTVESVVIPFKPMQMGAAYALGKFGSGALQKWGRDTILKDTFKNVVDKGLTNTAKSQITKQTVKKSVNDINNENYNAYLSELADEESILDQINSKLNQTSKQAAYKYVQTGHAKPLTQSQQDAIAHKVGSDFTGQYIIEPSGLQKAFGKIQLHKIENLEGKTEGVYSLLPVEVGQTTTLYSPKTFILENSNKPSIFGFYPEQSLSNSRNIAGMFYPKYDLSTVDPALTPKSPLYTLIHERSSHGTDDLMSKLKLAFRWKGDINKNPIHTVQEHYQKLINDIVANNPELNLDGSKLWYELRATNNEITARTYQKVFQDAKKAGKISQDASINDKGIVESLRPAYEEEINKLTPEQLAKIYASVNGYGEDYARSIMNALQKASLSGNNKQFNTFIDNLKSGIKYLPAAAPLGIGLNQNQYKNGGKMKISFGKSGIHIKKQNRGKFTEYCGGKVTQACIDRAKASGNSKLIKRAIFAENSRRWSHKNSGTIRKAEFGMEFVDPPAETFVQLAKKSGYPNANDLQKIYYAAKQNGATENQAAAITTTTAFEYHGRPGTGSMFQGNPKGNLNQQLKWALGSKDWNKGTYDKFVNNTGTVGDSTYIFNKYKIRPRVFQGRVKTAQNIFGKYTTNNK